MSKRFKGIFPALITPFTQDGRVDEDAIRSNVDFLQRVGVHGFVVCGTTGEFPLLGDEERKSVLRVVIEEVKNEVCVLPQTGAVSTNKTIELTKHARDCGADGVLIVTPYYYPYSNEALISHYEAVCHAVDLPVMIYNIPQRTGVNVDASLMERLAQIRGISGIKDSSRDIEQMEEYVKRLKGKIVIFQGSDALVYIGLTIGADGSVSAVANLAPEILVGIYNARLEGREDRARELQMKLLSIRDAIKIGTPMSGLKEAMNMRGLRGGYPRQPSLTLRPDEKEKLRKRLEELKIN